MYKRPGLQFFLEECHKIGDLVLFTAGSQEYADAIMNFIDPKGLVK